MAYWRVNKQPILITFIFVEGYSHHKVNTKSPTTKKHNNIIVIILHFYMTRAKSIYDKVPNLTALHNKHNM